MARYPAAPAAMITVERGSGVGVVAEGSVAAGVVAPVVGVGVGVRTSVVGLGVGVGRRAVTIISPSMP
jgi:hypothetical protein